MSTISYGEEIPYARKATSSVGAEIAAPASLYPQPRQRIKLNQTRKRILKKARVIETRAFFFSS
jgi:hypothetical protein